MLSSRSFLIIFTIISLPLYASSVFLYSEVKRLKLADSGLDEVDVVAIVDQRLQSAEQREKKGMLTNLLEPFQLASTSTPDNKRIYGNINARITLKEFLDIECPFCRKMHSGVKKVIDHSKGVINWQINHYPLKMHNPVAAEEARAIECIAEVYDNQKAWVALDKFIEHTAGNGQGVGDIAEFVRSFGLNGSQINNCLASDDHKEKINQHFQEGLELGVTGTPTIQIIDNKTNKSLLLKKYRTPEQILQAIQIVLQ